MRKSFRILFVFCFLNWLGFLAEAQVNRDMVPVGDQFWIDIFEMSCSEANALIAGSCRVGSVWKPNRIESPGVAESLCRAQGKQVPTLQQWMLAASNMGTHKSSTLVGDSTVKNQANVREASHGESLAPENFRALGIDGIGTVGMTGNRAEWVRSDQGGSYFICGGGYEERFLVLSEICRPASQSRSESSTVRCVLPAGNAQLKPDFSVRVQAELASYLQSRLSAPASKNMILQWSWWDDRFIWDNFFSSKKASDESLLLPQSPFYLDSYE